MARVSEICLRSAVHFFSRDWLGKSQEFEVGRGGRSRLVANCLLLPNFSPNPHLLPCHTCFTGADGYYSAQTAGMVECVCLLNPAVASLGLCLWLNSWTKVRVGYTVGILKITIRRMRNEQT